MDLLSCRSSDPKKHIIDQCGPIIINFGTEIAYRLYYEDIRFIKLL